MKLIRVKCKDDDLHEKYKQMFRDIIINGKKPRYDENKSNGHLICDDYIWEFPGIAVWTRKYPEKKYFSLVVTKPRGQFAGLNSGITSKDYTNFSEGKKALLQFGKEIEEYLKNKKIKKK